MTSTLKMLDFCQVCTICGNIILKHGIQKEDAKGGDSDAALNICSEKA